ncbi:hypothetical protein GIB67_027889 [Kingdonia uniflora]|uniref:Oxidative stress 3 n=1 Tax=Kingdonia uniflora TaxID=39325 RepID=A0A7J7LGB2_9MAGN|nr:hypothetical protein GIB67_027889 [Kingdonia uniflora]
MGQGTKCFRDPMVTTVSVFHSAGVEHGQWKTMDDDDDCCDSLSTTTSSLSDSFTSITSSSSDLEEDASSASLSNGPLYELSDLMAQLPIKRGLSNHFQGKSQSFTSLCNVKSIEDLAKKENPYTKKMKLCRSYGVGLENKKSFAPKVCSKNISKKASRGSYVSLIAKRSSSCRPLFSQEKTLCKT